nr:class I SAM-dependent methyltransferase [Flavihumibacter rivuli]
MQPKFKGLYHPYKKEYGPFDYLCCNNCKSLVIHPLPSNQELQDLYKSLQNGMIPKITQLREQFPLKSWYNQCIDHAIKDFSEIDAKSVFTWMDIGAGNGNLSVLMANRFPLSKGIAIDFGEKPEKLKDLPNIEWLQANLDGPDFNTLANSHKADLILSITVMEHISDPTSFLKGLCKLAKPGGRVYLSTPVYGNWVSYLMGKRWPYLIAGEHLHLPTLKGLKYWLQREAHTRPSMQLNANTSTTKIPYPIAYVAGFLNMPLIGRLMPSYLNFPFPTGMAEAWITVSE